MVSTCGTNFCSKWNETFISKTELHCQELLLFQSTSDVFNWDVRKPFTDYLCVHKYTLSYIHLLMIYFGTWCLSLQPTPPGPRFPLPVGDLQQDCDSINAKSVLSRLGWWEFLMAGWLNRNTIPLWMPGGWLSWSRGMKYLTLNSSYFRRNTPRNGWE